MPIQRHYILADGAFNGTVSGVQVTYNEETEEMVRRLKKQELKRFMEDAAVRAALSRGLSKVMIRSIPHSTTFNSKGERIPAEMHLTISAGDSKLAGHVLCYGFEPQRPPQQWYDNMTSGATSWSDRATSSNASTHSGDGTQPQQQQPSSSGGQWMPTGSNEEGRKWAWWDGTKYTEWR